MNPWLVLAGVAGIIAAAMAWGDPSRAEQTGTQTGAGREGVTMTRPDVPPEIPENPGPWSDEVWATVMSAIIQGVTLGELMLQASEIFPEAFGTFLEARLQELQAAYPEAQSALAQEGLVPSPSVADVLASQRRRQKRRETWGAIIAIAGAAAAAIVGAVATPIAGAIVATGAELAAGALLMDWTADAEDIVRDVGAATLEAAQQWVEENPEYAAYLAGSEWYSQDPDEANAAAEQVAQEQA